MELVQPGHIMFFKEAHHGLGDYHPVQALQEAQPFDNGVCEHTIDQQQAGQKQNRRKKA